MAGHCLREYWAWPQARGRTRIDEGLREASRRLEGEGVCATPLAGRKSNTVSLRDSGRNRASGSRKSADGSGPSGSAASCVGGPPPDNSAVRASAHYRSLQWKPAPWACRLVKERTTWSGAGGSGMRAAPVREPLNVDMEGLCQVWRNSREREPGASSTMNPADMRWLGGAQSIMRWIRRELAGVYTRGLGG
jgi:hypothetical protein